MMKKILLLLLLFTCTNAFSQIEMADTMRSNGKIYVVVAVALIVFAVITVYLILIDRKVTRLEKRMNN